MFVSLSYAFWTIILWASANCDIASQRDQCHYTFLYPAGAQEPIPYLGFLDWEEWNKVACTVQNWILSLPVLYFMSLGIKKTILLAYFELLVLVFKQTRVSVSLYMNIAITLAVFFSKAEWCSGALPSYCTYHFYYFVFLSPYKNAI